MNAISQVKTVAKYEMLKHLRGKKLLGLILISVLITFLIMGLPPLLNTDYPSSMAGFASTFLNFIGTFAVLAGMFFGGDAIVSEYQQRTSYLLFPNPIKKKAIYCGKFIAAMASSTLALLVFYGIVSFFTVAMFGGLPFELLYSIAAAVIALMAIMSAAFLVSTVMKGVASATMLVFFLFLMIMPIIDAAVIATQSKPTFTLTYNADIAKYIINDPYPTEASMGLGLAKHEFTRPVPEIGPGMAMMLGYFIAFFIIGLALFERKELI